MSDGNPAYMTGDHKKIGSMGNNKSCCDRACYDNIQKSLIPVAK